MILLLLLLLAMPGPGCLHPGLSPASTLEQCSNALPLGALLVIRVPQEGPGSARPTNLLVGWDGAGILAANAHCISLYWEGDLRNLSYFLNKGKELEFYNCHPTEDK